MNLGQVLSRNARLYPDEVALVQITPSQGLRRQITWREFDQTSSRIANLLVAQGTMRDDKVLLMMRNSIEFLVSYCAIIRAGAWVTPLNYRFTSQDIQYCADVSRARAAILNEDFAARVGAVRSDLATVKNYIFWGKGTPPVMTNLEAELARLSTGFTEIELRDEDPCALYFTSGTTGVPKPVLLMHKNLESAAVQAAVLRHLDHDDIFLLLGPLYHVGTMVWWLGHLYLGAPSVILIDAKVTPQHVLSAIDREGITQLALYVPWLLDLFKALDDGTLRREDFNLSSLRRMTIGSQPIPSSLSRRWKECFPNVKYHEGYGLTESTGGMMFIPLEAEKKPGSIGQPVFNWDARVVDDNGEDVPTGEVGELILRGTGVMKEYYRNPRETARVLKNGWLHTGDLARMDSQGIFYVVDRKKDVIISGGENIYPLDVEEVLMKHPKVFDAALIGIPHERLGEIPLAIIEPKPGVALTEEEMLRFCEDNFPRYRRPKRVVLDKVPRNPNGKIQKAELRKKYTGVEEYFRVQ